MNTTARFLPLALLASGLLLVADSCTPLPSLEDSDSPRTETAAGGDPAGSGYDPSSPTSPSDDATIGPTGGRFVSTSGIVVEIPPGALEEETRITARTTAIPPEMQGLGQPATRVAELLPHGLAFRLPIRVRLPWSSAPLGGERIAVLSVQPGDPYLEDVLILSATPADVEVSLHHFTTVAGYDFEFFAGLKVRDAPGCTSVSVRGLSDEIRRMFDRVAPGLLVAVPGLATSDPLHAVYAQPIVGEDLLATLRDGTDKGLTPFSVTAGWRSIAAQYVLDKNCRKGDASNAVARPGNSNHGDGTALDVHGAYPDRGACLAHAKAGESFADALKRAHPQWGEVFERHNFLWFGSREGKANCGDPPHFDHASGTALEMRAKGKEAFRRLWNNHHPCDLIDPGDDGTLMDRLGKSPASGFGSLDDGPLPETGREGAGCPKEQGPSAAKTCCPYRFPVCGPPTVAEPPTCHDTKKEIANCGACGNECLPRQLCAEGQCVCQPGLLFCPDVHGANGGRGACLDQAQLASDPDHCGGCSPCAVTEKCAGGKCVSLCPCPTGEAVIQDVPHACTPVACNAAQGYKAWSCSGGRPCCPDSLASGTSPYPECGNAYTRGFDECTHQTAAWCSRQPPPTGPDAGAPCPVP